ncbi:retrovirus-related Pol polyprotein from transposon 17.6 [Trichonephila clavipes]|nr:retrovirus-related Pol polyprotein from transposon 17.6 [Trichonephila clavipes]
MTPVDLPYVPIFLNETFITAIWDTGAEKSFISEEVYRKYFSYRLRQKTKDRVVTAQGASCCHLGRVELQIRIQEFQETWEFHILNNMQYQCILGIDFMKESKLTLDFDQKSLIIPDDQIKQLSRVEKPVEIDLSDTKLGERQKQKLRNLFNGFKGLFSDQPGLIHVLYHEIDTGDKGPVVSRPYRYDRVKQGIIDYHIEKMLQEDSPEAYRFAIDYLKLNAITKYPQYPLPVIDDLITNIPRTGVMSTLDLKSGYFQLAISPKDIEKTAFITRNGTFAFLRMPLGLSGAAPNFQKTIDIILKPVIGRFVSVYMDDVIITSPSFNEHLDHLNQESTVGNLDGSQISCVALRALALNSREQLIREQREDPDQLTEYNDTARILIGRFEKAVPLSTRLQLFSSCIQGPSESVQEFAARINKLGTQIFQSGNSAQNTAVRNANDQLLQSRFISGLRNDIRRFVLSRDPLNLDESINAALIEEQNMKLNQIASEERSGLSSAQTENRVLSALADRLEEINLRVGRLQEASSVTARKSGGNSFNRRENVFKCFYCGIQGHRQADCRKKQRDERAARYQPPGETRLAIILFQVTPV